MDRIEHCKYTILSLTGNNKGMITFIAMCLRILCLLCILSLQTWSAEIAKVRFDRARQLAGQGRTEEALQEYRAILLDDPENASAYYEAGKVRQQQGKWGSAAQNFNLSLQRNPEYWDAAEALAKSYEQMGQKEKALATWRKLIDRAPSEYKARATASIDRTMGGTPQAAPSVVKSQTAGNSRYDSPEFVEGVAQYQAENWKKSLESWKKVLSVDSKNPGAFYYAGVCRYNQGEYDKAEYNLQKAFSYPDKGFNAHYYLARIHEKRKDWKKARAQYESYLAKTTNPEGKKDAQKRLDALPSEKGKDVVLASATPAPKEDAVTPAKDSIVAPPAVPNPEKVEVLSTGILFPIGSVSGQGAQEMQNALKYAQAKDFNQAIESLKSIRLQYPGTPNSIAAGYALAAFYRYLGLSENLRILASSILREDVPEPYRSGLGFLLASSLKDLGELSAARSVLDSGKADLALGPTSVQLNLLQSQIAELQKSEKDVPALLEKAILAEKDPLKRADLRLKLGQTLLRQGMPANAEKAFEALLESCSPYTTEQCRKGLYALGDMFYQSKAWDKALDKYRKVTGSYDDPEDSPWGLYQIGNIYRQKKMFAESVKAYEILIQKYPASYWADQAKWNKEDVIWRGQNSKVLGGN